MKKMFIEDIEERMRNPSLHDELASMMHDKIVKWMQIAQKYDVDRSHIYVPYSELKDIDKLAPLRDADDLLDLIHKKCSALCKGNLMEDTMAEIEARIRNLERAIDTDPYHREYLEGQLSAYRYVVAMVVEIEED